MPETYRKLYQGQPGTSAATLFTATASGMTLVKLIKAINATTGTPATIGLFHDGVAALNRILPDIPLNPGEHLVDDSLYMLEASDTIGGIASVAATITVVIYGVELT